MKSQIINILLNFDRFINSLLLGDKDETISSRFARNVKKTWVAKLGCKVIAFILRDPEHCKKSLEFLDSEVESNDHPVVLFIIVILIILAAYYFFKYIV